METIARKPSHNTFELMCAHCFEQRLAVIERLRCLPVHAAEIAKRRNSRYRPGERGWVKIKNREYWRYELEREAAINLSGPKTRQFA